MSLMYKEIRKKNIKRNGRRTEPTVRVACGDVIALYLHDDVLEQAAPQWDFLKAGKALDILYEDDNLLLLNKPVGLLVHPDGREFSDTLIGRAQRYLYETGTYDPADENSFAPALVNRIDRNTEGLVIAAKNAAALRILNARLKTREIKKEYLCLVFGTMPKDCDLLCGYLQKDERQNRVSVTAAPPETSSARIIRTQYTVLEAHDGLSLLSVDLLTGRTHQIRAHLASIGHPLYGDGKYGGAKRNAPKNRQALCAYRLTFCFTSPAGELDYLNGRCFTLPPPGFAEDFRAGKLKGEMKK